MQQKEAVRKMFDNIAGSYDSLNHIMSLDADKSWRKTMLGKLGEGVDGRPLKVLDLACGTGDSTIAIARGLPRAKVTGLDLSEGMLKVMEGKVEKEANNTTGRRKSGNYMQAEKRFLFGGFMRIIGNSDGFSAFGEKLSQ